MVKSRDHGVALAVGTGCLSVLLGVAGCTFGTGGSERPEVTTTPVDAQLINAAYGAPDSRLLELAIDSCNQDPQATVEESTSEVRVTVSLSGVDAGLACQDSVKVELSAPLAGRRVIDAVSGEAVPVQPAE